MNKVFDPQHAPIEEVIEYLTVTLKKKWGTTEGTEGENEGIKDNS